MCAFVCVCAHVGVHVCVTVNSVPQDVQYIYDIYLWLNSKEAYVYCITKQYIVTDLPVSLFEKVKD